MERKKPIRRRFKRCTVRLLIDYWCEGRIGSDYATTLGAGGLFISTRNPFDSGTRLSLRFMLPSGLVEHDLDGRVVWCHAPGDDPPDQTYGMGIAFDHPAGDPALVAELEALGESLPEVS